MTNIERHEVTVDELQVWFGSRLKPAPSNQQFEAMVAKINTGMRWPGDKPPTPGEPGYCGVSEKCDVDRWDFKAASKAAKTLHDSLPAIISFWENVWTPDKKPQIGALSMLQAALAESLERIEYPFGKCDTMSPHVRASKEWQQYALTLARFIIGQLVSAGHAQPTISRNSIVVRVICEVTKCKRVPGINAVTRAAVAIFLERWDDMYGLTLGSIALLTTKSSRTICGLNREIGLCHLSDSEFALRIGSHHDGESCKHCQTEQFHQ